MSKWCSVRFKRVSQGLIAIIALSGALAGCGQNGASDSNSQTQASTIVTPEMRVDAVPQEEPAVARSQWRAVNDSARNITGNLHVSLEALRGGPVIFAFATGVTVRGQPIADVPADQRSGVGGQSFAAVLGGDPRVDAHLYRVLEEQVAHSAPSGGLCGATPAKFLAVSEFVDSSSHWVFRVAAFKGDRPPGASGDDPQLCGAYAFAAQN
jgi:hypothetical protein